MVQSAHHRGDPRFPSTPQPGFSESRASRWQLVFLGVVALWASAIASAQDPSLIETAASRSNTVDPASSKPVNNGTTAPTKSALERVPVETRWLPNDKGELVEVQLDASLAGYLEYLRTRRDVPNERPPVVSVTGVELEGDIVGEMATLRARLTVEVIGASQPIPFPLGLAEAVIQQAIVRAAGRAIFNGKDPDRGYTWWLDGSGTYEFDLKLGVPVRKLTPWRRVQLSLPSAPVTTLRLRLPVSDPHVKLAPEDTVWDVQPLEGGQTEVRASGFGTRLDLSWQAVPLTGTSTTSLDANTTILVRGASDGLFLEATQVVRALQGVFREVVVRLPDQGELLQVDGSEVQETRVDPEAPERVTVLLAAPTAGPITLKWRVRVPHSERKRLVLNGFAVEAAKRQAGSVGLVEVDDARWTVVEAGEPHLERMNVGEFRAQTNGVPVVRAYRFYAQPFSLRLALESVAAYYDVQPVLGLYAADDELRLEARFQVHTFRGKLTQLALQWPGWRAEGWVLEGIQPQGTVVTGFTTGETDGAEDRILVNLSDQAPDHFELRLSARRARRSGEETRLSLPLVEGPTTSTTQVVLLAAVNVDAELSPRGETALRKLPQTPAPNSQDFGLEPGLHGGVYRLDTDERQFTLRVSVQPQRVRVTTVAQARLTSRRLELRQTVKHHVDYARLSDLALIVPAEIAERVTFRLGDVELVPEWTDAAVPQDRVAWLTLPGGQLGTVSVDLLWEQSLPDAWVGDRAVNVTIPLARSDFAPTDQSTLEMLRPAWFELSASDPQWLLQHASDDLVRWQTASPAKEFPLVLSPAGKLAEPQFQVSHAVIRAAVDPSGGQEYRMQVRLTGSGPELYVHLPSKSSPPMMWWDGQLVSRDRLVELPAGSRHYSLHLPDTAEDSREHLLTIDYQLATGRPLGWSAALAVVTPQFPQCEWSAQVIWEIHLPADQHLWMPPVAAAMYHWQREGWYWRRVSAPRSEEIQTWLQGDLAAPPTDLAPAQGNVYTFRQLGAATELRFRTLSSPMALALGAGCTIAVGFLALRFSWLRSLMVLLGALCGVAILSLWYLAELELLFQPMLLGALFPTLIALAELWSRRRALESAWTLSASVNEYHSTSGDVAPTQGLPSGHPDSATIYRAPLPGDSKSLRVTAESQFG